MMRAGAAWIVFLVAGAAGASDSAPDTRSWERWTLEVGAELTLPTCHDFSVDEYDGRACRGTVTGRALGLLRSRGGFVFKPELVLGVAYDSDLVVAHYFEVDDALKGEEFVMSLLLGFGGSFALPHGEVRATGGPRLQFEVATPATRGRTEAAGFDLDPYGRVALSAVLDLEIDGEIGDAVRLGPRLQFGVGNELGFLFASDCGESSWWCDEARLVHGDVDIEWSIALGMAFPAASGGAFAFEIGPRFELSAYENTTYRELSTRLHDRPRCTLDITPQLFVGVQIRI